MNHKKWQGATCLLVASLMISSVFAAPVRKETTTMPQATTAPGPSTVPKVTTAPESSTIPKATTKPEPSKTPQVTTTPRAIESPKAVPCPKTTEVPQKQGESTKPNCKKVHQNEKNNENQKPFTLDHFKMIINALKKMGVEENQIVTYVKDGKKLEDILKAEKINTNKFKKCITKEYFKVVDEATKTGQITAEQSKQLKAAIKETIKNWLPKK